jgi:hypothetical protein
VIGSAWIASTTTSWLHILTPSAAGGLFRFTYDRNTDATRTGTISFNGGQATLTVTQAGEGYLQSGKVRPLLPPIGFPIGVAADAAGNVYIADAETYFIEKWTAATGQVTTLEPTVGTAGPTAVDPARNVYFAIDGITIEKLTAATGQIAILTSSISGGLVGLAADRSGNVYFSTIWSTGGRRRRAK